VKNTGLMCWDLDIANEGWVAPDADRVVWEAAGADNLLVMWAPAEAGDLRTSIDTVDASTSGGVPEVDVAIIRTTTSGKDIWSPWTPAESLDGSLVVGLGELWSGEGASIPDGDEVVVATSSKLSAISAPLKSTNLGGVGNELGDLVLGDADIMVEDEAAASTSGKGVVVPAHNTNASIMTVHTSDLSTLLNVPDLNLSRTEADTNVSSIAGPLHAADIGIWAGLEERADRSGLCRPDIDVALKADGDLVVGAPVEEVEVVVINKARGIQNSLWCSCNASSELGGGSVGVLERAIVLCTEVDWLGRFWCGWFEGKDASIERDTASRGEGVLVCNSIWGWAGVGGLWLLVTEAEALQGCNGIICGRGKDGRSFARACLWSLLS
jgi:hypothetical protein